MQQTSNSIIVERHIPCPVCTSTDAYCLYKDGHGHCFSCKYHYLPDMEKDLNETMQFVGLRGLSRETLKFYDMATRCDSNGKPIELNFPYRTGTKIRSLAKKDFHWVGKPSPGLFGLDKFAVGAHPSIVLTEGELDAASLYQVLRVSSVC